MWQSILLNMAMGMLPQIIGVLSPVLRAVLATAALEMYQKAKDSENPYDDIVAAGLLAALNVPTPKSGNP